jgi:hypothetical protein
MTDRDAIAMVRCMLDDTYGPAADFAEALEYAIERMATLAHHCGVCRYISLSAPGIGRTCAHERAPDLGRVDDGDMPSGCPLVDRFMRGT